MLFPRLTYSGANHGEDPFRDPPRIRWSLTIREPQLLTMTYPAATLHMGANAAPASISKTTFLARDKADPVAPGSPGKTREDQSTPHPSDSPRESLKPPLSTSTVYAAARYPSRNLRWS